MSLARRRSFRVESEEVAYAAEGLVTADGVTIAELIADAAGNVRRRMRLCTHANVDDPVHEMLIVHERSCYVQPHKHLGKSESIHVIDGNVDVVLFDERGEIVNIISMGPYGSDKPFFYRIAEPRFHTLIIRSDVLVFHETTSGPFRREQTAFPDWAPDGEDADETAAYESELSAAIARYFSANRGV